MATPDLARPKHPGGRSRDATVEARVLDTTIALLAEVGYDRATIEAVAARAGVGRPTIYRRWATREAMVIAALEGAFDAANPAAPDSGDVRADLVALLGNTIDLLATTAIGAVIRALLPEVDRSPALGGAVGAFERRRRALLLAILSRAQAEGRLRATLTPALAVDLALGPVYFRLLISRDPLDRALAGIVADAVLTSPHESSGTCPSPSRG